MLRARIGKNGENCNIEIEGNISQIIADVSTMIEMVYQNIKEENEVVAQLYKAYFTDPKGFARAFDEICSKKDFTDDKIINGIMKTFADAMEETK